MQKCPTRPYSEMFDRCHSFVTVSNLNIFQLTWKICLGTTLRYVKRRQTLACLASLFDQLKILLHLNNCFKSDLKENDIKKVFQMFQKHTYFFPLRQAVITYTSSHATILTHLCLSLNRLRFGRVTFVWVDLYTSPLIHNRFINRFRQSFFMYSIKIFKTI